MTTGGLPAIRPARPDEAGELSSLARRSKAYWGYPEDFLARAEPDLTVSTEDIEDHVVRVLEASDGRRLGFYHLVIGEPAILKDLWLEPGSIGRGLGRTLWRDALATATAAGALAVELDADPHAAGFYERMGAVRVGETASRLEPGRMLPRMRMAPDRVDAHERALNDHRPAHAHR